MSKKKRKFTKAKKYSFNNPRDIKKIDKFTYQDYLRKQNSEFKNVDYKHLEEIFTNEVHYKAMKELPIKEKQVLYVVVETSDLEKACDEMKMSKTEIIEIKTKAINRFKKNVEKYSKKNGGDFNG